MLTDTHVRRYYCIPFHLLAQCDFYSYRRLFDFLIRDLEFYFEDLNSVSFNAIDKLKPVSNDVKDRSQRPQDRILHVWVMGNRLAKSWDLNNLGVHFSSADGTGFRNSKVWHCRIWNTAHKLPRGTQVIIERKFVQNLVPAKHDTFRIEITTVKTKTMRQDTACRPTRGTYRSWERQ